MEPISTTILLSKVVSSLFDYGLNTGWDKLFKGERVLYKKKLVDILSRTVREFESRNNLEVHRSKFPFYHSEIFLESILKLRLFKNESKEEIKYKIKEELKTNDNIKQPSEKELTSFYEIFIKNLNNDEEFKKLEIDTHFKEVIFEIHDQVIKLRDDLKSISNEEIGSLKKEYEVQVDDIFEEITLLRFSTVLNKLKKLELRIKSNLKGSNKLLLSRVEFVKAICHDHIDENDLAKECYIKAYLLNSSDINNIEIACWVYFKQNDNSYKELLEILLQNDPFNPYAWAIKAINSDNIAEHINQRHKFIQDNFRYKRNIFNYLISNEPSKLVEIDFLFENINYDIPNIVTYDNLNDLIFIANLYFSKFVNNVQIDFIRQIEINDQSLRLYNILEKLNAIKSESELGLSYNQLCIIYIWLKSEMYFEQVSVTDLIEVTQLVKNLDKIHALFIANSLQKREEKDSALKLIEGYDDDEMLLSFKLFCASNLEIAKKISKDYLDVIKYVNEKNVVNICAYLESIIKQEFYTKEEVFSIIHSKEYSFIHFKELLLLLTTSYSKEIVNLDDILLLKEYLIEYERLNIFLAVLLYDNKYFNECVEFVSPYLNDNEKIHPGLLKILIYAIDSLKTSHQEKLPRLLCIWRENFEPNVQFLSMELELYTHLKQWDKLKEINTFALKVLPNNEYFFTSYISSLINSDDFNSLENIINNILDFNFQFVENALYIGNLLIRYKYTKEGFSLLYKYAKDKDNVTARWQFFILSTEFQDVSIFQEYETVQRDCYVQFIADGSSQIKYIPKDQSNEILIKELLNKNKGESFSITNNFSSKIVNIKIERIINKELNLLIEIQEEFKKPISDYPVEVIQFEEQSLKSFETELIKKFGLKQDFHQIKREKYLEDYWNFILTFSEIAPYCFDNDYIATYYSLISKESKGFMLNPIKPYLGKIDDVQDVLFVLDLTSGLLFFELSKSLDIIFQHKFVVGQSLINHIDALIHKTSTYSSNFTLEIKSTSVIPHFIPENFNDNRIKFLSDIKEWFLTNCSVELPSEKINFSRSLYEKNRNLDDFDLILETSILGNRLNHALISDDLIYSKFLIMSNRQIPTDHYLTNFYQKEREGIFNHLIKNRYVGVNFSSDDLYNCYVEKNHIEKSHVYEFCLKNLEVYYKINAGVCNSIILDFLKKIAINPIFTQEILEFEARNIISRCLILNISYEIVADLEVKISHIFKLLPLQSEILNKTLADSINIVMNR